MNEDSAELLVLYFRNFDRLIRISLYIQFQKSIKE